MSQTGKILRLVFSSYRPNRGNYMENHPIYRHQLSPGDLTFSLAILKFDERLGRSCVELRCGSLWHCFEGRILIQSLAQPCDSQWQKRSRTLIVHNEIALHTVSIYRTKSPTKRLVHFCFYLVTKNVMFIGHLSLKWCIKWLYYSIYITFYTGPNVTNLNREVG